MFDMIPELEMDLSTLSRDELLDRLIAVEEHTRRLVAVQARLDAEVESRGMAHELGYTSTSAMLSDMLRLAPGQAWSRVHLARALAPRRALTGEVLDPAFPLVAAAVADGVLSDRHAQVITRTLDRIPDYVPDDPRWRCWSGRPSTRWSSTRAR
jgi:Domain of unknown function (DUF222)